MESKPPIEELLHEEESATLDFKRDQYPFSKAADADKSELLKDILAFANAWRRTDAYILIGVEEVKGGRSKPIGIQIELDDAQIQQFVNSKTQQPIDFNYRTILFEGVKIGVITIPVQSRPFYLNKAYGKLSKDTVYIRRGSSTAEATPNEIFEMGRSVSTEVQVIPNLIFEFANLENKKKLGTHLDLEKVLLDIPDESEIPDYENPSNTIYRGIQVPNIDNSRPEYYRELVKYYHLKLRSEKLAFVVENSSSKPVSDIRVEIIASKKNKDYRFISDSRFPDIPQKNYNPSYMLTGNRLDMLGLEKNTIRLEDLGEIYRIEVRFDKVQPKQKVYSGEAIYILGNRDFQLEMEVTIYADEIPEPVRKTMGINCHMKNESSDLDSILRMHEESLLS